MNVLNELMSPFPLHLLAVAVFGLIFILFAIRFFRMPANFGTKEELRDEIRFRLTSESMSVAKQRAAEEAASEPAAAGAQPPEAAVPDDGAAKKP